MMDAGWRALLLGSAVAAAGCGGIVVFEAEGGGGPGTGGGGPSADGVGGGSAPSAACVAYCEARDRLQCSKFTFEECVHFCELTREYTGRCGALADEGHRCVTPRDADECDGGALERCDDLRDRLEACVYPPGDCEQIGLGPEDDHSLFVLRCGSTEYSSRCTGNFAEADHVDCTCFIDAVEVGTCVDGLSTLGMCCGRFFSENGG